MRDTYAFVDEELVYRGRAAATLLDVSESTLRNYANESGLQIRRANEDNPQAVPARIYDVKTIFDLVHWRRENGSCAHKIPKRQKGTMPAFIAVDVVKGGVGKSTSCAQVAVHLQLQGFKCLVVDLDIQANLTQMFGYEADIELEDAPDFDLNEKAVVTSTLASVMVPYILQAERGNKTGFGVEDSNLIKRPFGENGPHLIPADTYFCDLEFAIMNSRSSRETFFSRFFRAAVNGEIEGLDLSAYDVVLMDCPPSISFASTNALAVSDIVLAPIKLDAFSVKGLSKLVSELNALNESYPAVAPDLVVLPTHSSASLFRFPQSRFSKMQAKLDAFAENISPVYISLNEEFPKTLDKYLPLSLIKPSSTAFREYHEFAQFLSEKILTVLNKNAGAKS